MHAATPHRTECLWPLRSHTPPCRWADARTCSVKEEEPPVKEEEPPVKEEEPPVKEEEPPVKDEKHSTEWHE